MAIKYRLSDVSHLTGRDIFVDANVLIYLFWPTSSIRWEIDYATAYSSLLKQGNPLYIDFLVISEVINQMLRIEHKKKQPSVSFKQFRDSADGQQVLSNIYLIVENQILNQFKVISKSFSKNDIQSFLKVDSLDFIDKGILNICRNNNFVLLTNDKDFKNVNIDLFTCNPAI